VKIIELVPEISLTVALIVAVVFLYQSNRRNEERNALLVDAHIKAMPFINQSLESTASSLKEIEGKYIPQFNIDHEQKKAALKEINNGVNGLKKDIPIIISPFRLVVAS